MFDGDESRKMEASKLASDIVRMLFLEHWPKRCPVEIITIQVPWEWNRILIMWDSLSHLGPLEEY